MTLWTISSRKSPTTTITNPSSTKPINFTKFNVKTIATEGQRAVIATSVLIGLIAVVTRLAADVNNTISTSGHRTVIAAGIVIIEVCVIAGLDVGLYIAVAAARRSAIVCTGVRLQRVAIVAFFTRLLNTIAATRSFTVVAT